MDMVGFSCDGQHPCLVYAFMANGSLFDRLACKVITIYTAHSAFSACAFTQIIQLYAFCPFRMILLRCAGNGDA